MLARRLACLTVAVAALALGSSAAVAAPPEPPSDSRAVASRSLPMRSLDDQLRIVAIQELLIGSGNLDKETGHIKQSVMQSAVTDFRAAIGSQETGPLTEAELQKLQDFSDGFLAFADYTRVHDPDTDVTVTLPRSLFNVVPKAKTSPDRNWTTYVSSYGGMQIHVFRYSLLAETPVSLVARLVERRQNINFERLDVTGSEFAIDAVADYSNGKSYALSIRGWETDGHIVGFQSVFDLDYAQVLQVPDLPVPAGLKTGVLPNGRYSSRSIEVTEREGNWRRVIKALVNRISSDFEISNGWRAISSGECRKRRLTSGRGGQDRQKVVRVVYATDRQRVPALASAAADDKPDVDKLYAPAPDDRLHIGCAIVSVPSDPAVAARILRPRPTARGQLEAFDPKRHFSLDSVVEFGSSEKLGRGEELLLVDEGKEGTFERALLMIHGYNTSFADALLRIAQVAAAVDEDLRVYLFSWPSRERYFSYFDDLDNAERAEQSLQYFMKLILRDANVRQLDVIAHSMGSQSLLRSIDGLKTVFDQRAWGLPAAGATWASQVRLRLGQVIFAAPDVSRPIFERQLATLAPYARRVTVYTSSADRALWFSELFRFAPRAGSSGSAKEPFRVRGVHVIDVAAKPLPRLSPQRITEFNHNYFAENPSVLNDIQSILNDGTARDPGRRLASSRRPLKHSFVEVPYPSRPDSIYWRLVEPSGR